MGKACKVTEAKFKTIKTLVNSGMPYAQIQESIGVSKVVIGAVKQSDTYEDYKHRMYTMSGSYRRKMAEKKKEEEQLTVKAGDIAKAVEKEKPQTESTTTMMISGYQVNRIIEQLTKQNEILTLISNKLAFIVDELTR